MLCNVLKHLTIIEHIQKLEILYEFDDITPKRGSPICHVLLTVQNTHRRALLFIDKTVHWIFTQTKISSIYRRKPIVTYWAWKKRQALLTT